MLKVAGGVVLGGLLLAILLVGAYVLYGPGLDGTGSGLDPADLVVRKDGAECGDHGFCDWRAKAKNTGAQPISFWKVRLLFLDSSGQVIDTDYYASLATLKPGETTSFEITHKLVNGLKSIRYEVEEIR